MVGDFDEVARRREALRTATGQFGTAPVSPPEMLLEAPATSVLVTRLLQKTSTARQAMVGALLDEIDATMPAEADFVNYEVNPEGTHLIIREAIGGYGEELDLQPFARTSELLAQLGQPYFDFDGDRVVSSVDDYGWERTQPYSSDRAAGARRAGELARMQWRQAFIAQQRAVIDEIWSMVDPAADGIDFSWDEDGRCMRLAAVIHPDGRTGVDDVTWTGVNTLSAHLTEPQLAPMLRNELSGLYRLTRGV